MFTILNTREAIKKAHESFAANIQTLSNETVNVVIGYPGGAHENVPVFWLSSLGIWAHFGSPQSERARYSHYWDVFGIGTPDKSVSIVCQINSPRKAINRRAAGAFGLDDKGRLAVFHRGIVRSKGMNKKFFRNNYNGKWVSVNDGGTLTELVLVAIIGSIDFGIHLRQFVFEVARIKELAGNKN